VRVPATENNHLTKRIHRPVRHTNDINFAVVAKAWYRGLGQGWEALNANDGELVMPLRYAMK
jgi:hypothetical protein